ncbi:DeoR-family transcriptional regulator [Escherichia coli]|uniref:DeoR-family transcriptional regulator n=1 Tax=Escherichia coli TaxID=562 RepID=A0A376TMM8_ECOLX|nr:DeoR-family transcriptional regulator [Escherichia coli]
MKKYVSLKQASQLVNPGESVVINCGSTAFLLGREMCGKPVQIITNYLPLANYLIDQEHDSVIIMGGQYNKSQSITLSPQGSGKQSLCRALDVYQRKRADRRRVV